MKQPNIIIFMMDTQGIFNLSCYGYYRKTTPNYDAFSREATLFTNHFVTAPWTLPVHASLFTGRHESGHGASAQHEGLEPGLPNIGETLARNGYRTVALCENRWAVSEDALTTGPGFEELIQYKDAKYKVDQEYIFKGGADEDDKASLKMIGVAKRWIEENALGKSKPFFMFMNNALPHDPYQPPQPFRDKFMLEGIPYAEQFRRKGHQLDSTIGEKALTFTEWQMQRYLYDACTACLDQRFGLLIEILKKFGIYDDTLIIVTGDHGDSLGQHTHYAYHSQNGLYDAVVHTPLIIRLPKVFPRGRRAGELVQITDVFPTILDLLKLKEPKARKSIQGLNLLKALKSPIREFAVMEAQWPLHTMRRAWAFYAGADPRQYGASLKAIRNKRYKFVWSSFGDDALYDLRKDPDERWNIIRQKPEVARKMMKQLEDYLLTLEQRYFPDYFRGHWKSSSMDPLAIRRLQAWGLFRPTGVVPPWKRAKKR